MKKLWSGFILFIGFWLSPLSPWNDLFTNIPIAYALAFLISFSVEALFLPTFVLGYWFSNILGFNLMHYGYVCISDNDYSLKKYWKASAIATILYTVLVVALIQLNILPSASDITPFLE